MAATYIVRLGVVVVVVVVAYFMFVVHLYYKYKAVGEVHFLRESVAPTVFDLLLFVGMARCLCSSLLLGAVGIPTHLPCG